MLEIDLKNLPDNVFELKEMVRTIAETVQEKERNNDKTIKDLQTRNNLLIEELHLLRLKHYSRISERFRLDEDAIQRSLFPDFFGKISVSDIENQEITVIERYNRKKPGRKRLAEDLERVEIEHDIPEAEKECVCGATKSRIGEEVSEKLQILPAKFWVERHIRPKYCCKSCEGIEDKGKTVSIAPMPVCMIPKSISTPSLLSHIFIGKFCDALPFYRQEKQFKRYGVQLSRATMVNWALKIAESLKPLLTMLRLYVLSGPLINIDETTVQVINEPGKKANSKSYCWVLRGGLPESSGFLYHYAPSRSTEVARGLLKDYEGFVQTDGFSSYNFLNNHPDIEHFGCWAHVRRRFNEVLKVSGNRNKGLASEAMTMIRQLYKIEKQAKTKGLDEQSIFKLRQEVSKPIVENFGIWLNDNVSRIPEQSLLGKALRYTLSQWSLLIKYLNNGIVKMDNNLVENAIRPFVIGRKNWLFSMTPEGAEATALFYSMIETAKANGLEPFKYLEYLFKKFPTI